MLIIFKVLHDLGPVYLWDNLLPLVSANLLRSGQEDFLWVLIFWNYNQEDSPSLASLNKTEFPRQHTGSNSSDKPIKIWL